MATTERTRTRDLSKTQPIPVMSDLERLAAYRASQSRDDREPLLPPVKPRTSSQYNVSTPRTRSKTLVEIVCSCGPTTDCGGAK